MEINFSSQQMPTKKGLLSKLDVFLVFLGSSLVTLGQLLKVIEGFLAQMSNIKCISNVLVTVLDGYFNGFETNGF